MTQQQVEQERAARRRLRDESSRHASSLRQKLSHAELMAAQEQERMSAKIARMKKLSHLALGVSSKPPAGEAEATLAVANARRNRALLYDQTRRG